MKLFITALKSPIPIAIVSTIAGIVFSNLLDWSIDPLVEKNNLGILTFVTLGTFSVLIGMIIVSLRTSEINETHKEIIRRMGVSARLFAYGQGCLYKNPFEYPTPLIKNAQEILAIDYCTGSEVADMTDEQESGYRTWYDTLNSAAKRSGISYQRILQLPFGKTETINSKTINDPIVLDHFSSMVECNHSNNRVRLMTCPELMPNICIIIIDRKYVIWEILSIEKGERYKFEMDLVIEDGVGHFVRDLIVQFENMVNESIRVTKVIQDEKSA